MDGEFKKKGFTKVCNILGLISGAFLALLFGYFIYIGEYSTLDDVILSCFFVCFGVFVSVFCGLSLYVNRKAYIHVDDQKISAFCHFGLSLNCNLSDVSDMSYASTGLNIRLKNGKKYNLMNLLNVKEIGPFIHKRISAKQACCPDKNRLISVIPPLRKKRKWEGIWSMICCLLLFPEILLTSALTGGKELHEFGARDWTAFSVMAGVGVVTIVMFYVLLRKYLLDTDALNKIQGTLYQAILHTAPVQPGNPIKLLIDSAFCPTVRLTVFGFPNSDDVYFTVETINVNYEIQCIHTSRVYSGINELAPEIADMTEIPLPMVAE